jgi:hypothetical protein
MYNKKINKILYDSLSYKIRKTPIGMFMFHLTTIHPN